MNAQLVFIRRLGPDQHSNGAQCSDTSGCPDVWELADGDFAIIGTDITVEAGANLPPSAGCGANERIIRLPRNLMVNAKRHIPDSV